MAYLVRIVALCSALFLFRSEPFAQSDLEDVIVETYYISDANDATDTIGGGVPVGSRTYRVYLDLCTDCALRSVYGDINHALLIQSTAPIFNHNDRGKTFGHELSNSALDEGTVALDSYLSLGAGEQSEGRSAQGRGYGWIHRGWFEQRWRKRPDRTRTADQFGSGHGSSADHA